MSMIEDRNDTSLTDYDKNEILNKLSDDIILDNLLKQIASVKENLNINNTDLFEYFINRYRFIMTKYEDNEEIISSAREIMNEILDSIVNAIGETFKFKINFNDSLLIDDKIQNVEALYNFFVISIKDGLKSLGIHYIKTNLTSLKKTLKVRNKKDLSYINIKKLIDNENTPVIFYVPEIIHNMPELSNELIIELMISEEPDLFYNYVINQILAKELEGDVSFEDDFFENIKDLLNNAYSIQMEIQSRLIEYLK